MTTEKHTFTIGGRGLGVLDGFCSLISRPRHEGIKRMIWIMDMYIKAKKKGYRFALVSDEKKIYLDL